MTNTQTSSTASSSFTKGTLLAVRITGVDVCGIAVRTMVGGCGGMIKASSFGRTVEQRRAALEHYAEGQILNAIVEAYFPKTKMLIFTLPTQPTVDTPCAGRKPMKHVLPQGTTILVDAANLFGTVRRVLPTMTAVDFFRSMYEGLTAAGYKPQFFLESRTYGWICYNDPAPEAFKTFCACYVSVVHGEADETLLQLAEITPSAVILSNDYFRDYAEMYPQVVGSERVRTYNVFAEPHPTVSMVGVKTMIPLHSTPMKTPKAPAKPREAAPELACIEAQAATPVTWRASAVYDSVATLQQRARRHDPAALQRLAECYALGLAVHRDIARSVRLDHVAVNARKRDWQIERRRQRRRANAAFKFCA